MSRQLRNDLEAAAKGHAVTYGDAAPNLFADALAEIKRLDAIEADIKRRFAFNDPENDTKGYYSNRLIMAEAIQQRCDIGKRLGEAVGGLPKVSLVKAVT